MRLIAHFRTPAAILLSSFILVACQKTVDDNSETNLAEAEVTAVATADDAEAELTFNAVAEDVSHCDTASTGQADVMPGAFGDSAAVMAGKCFTVTVTTPPNALWPRTVTVDFGAGCTGRDGHLRKGKIISVFTKRLMAPGAEVTTHFDGYYVDSVHVEGTHIIKNNSTQEERIFTRTVVDGKLSRPSGNYIKWNASHTITQVAGLGTPLWPFDDVVKITGHGNGENKHGDIIRTWTRTIMEPLRKRFVCRWIDKGTVSITRNDKTALLDFGNGACNNTATLTMNGRTKTITLR